MGAAGFLGSYLVDKLLEKNIQVIGVDDLTTGKKINLQKASEDKNFHLLIESAQDLELALDRLDYLFIVTESEFDLEKVLKIFKDSKCRCLFVSSIDLYDRENGGEELSWLKSSEVKIAKFAAEFKLNARILRLGPVFGPRMHFRTKDPLNRLIQQSLAGDLHKDVSLEFSSRALYVEDAVDLIIRTIFSGATSLKIFDGIEPNPVKVLEIKQVLLDPLWYENREFAPSPLPPWPTPNLEKTVKFLNWHPKEKLVANLRQTLNYFKDNEIEVPKPEAEDQKPPASRNEEDEKKEKIELPQEKKEELELFKRGVGRADKRPGKSRWGRAYLLILFLLIGYALIWPVFKLGWGVWAFKSELNGSFANLQKGNFEESLNNVKRADRAVAEAESTLEMLEPLSRSGILEDEYGAGESLIILSRLSTQSAESTILGIQALLQGLRAVTGEATESPVGYFNSAQRELSSASQKLAQAAAILKSSDFKAKMPRILNSRISALEEKLTAFIDLADKAQAISQILPNLVGMEKNKSYLVLLQNNMELRPGGGFIGSFAKVSFEGGKLKKIAVNDIYAIDGALSIHVEPPKEIKEDLGQKDWFLRDSNWEPDFPTSARQAEWFYTKETGERVEGVIALDVSAMEKLLTVLGPLDLSDYQEKITSENLFKSAVTHAELSFFPGSQAKKSFITALANEVFNKMFFLPQNNWPGILGAIGRSLDEKHISIYLNDAKMFSYIDSQGWSHVMPRVSKETEKQDFLSVVEANLGANKANYYLDRSYNLETVVGKDGEIKHRLRISYTNRSPSDAFPGGRYKNRLRVYLPFGSNLTRALWGEADKTGEVSGFVDWGRTGYSLLLELNPKEQKTLVLDYTVPVKVEFGDGKASYRLNIIKQQGILNDPLQWKISYPINYQVVSSQAKLLGSQEQTISTDLSIDRSFEVQFKQ